MQLTPQDLDDVDLDADTGAVSVVGGPVGLWPFSPSLTDEAGETEAVNDGMSNGTRQTRFEVEFSFASFTQALQAGLQMSTAPDRGDDARMSFIRLEDLPDGMSVDFVDYRDNAPFGEFLGDPEVVAPRTSSRRRFWRPT